MEGSRYVVKKRYNEFDEKYVANACPFGFV